MFDPVLALQQTLEAHAISAELTPDGIKFLESNLIFPAEIVRVTKHRQTTNVQLDIRIQSKQLSKEYLIESFSGTGTDEEEAAQDAFQKFLRASFHVLIATFVDRTLDPEQVDWETWTAGDQSWQVCMGPLISHDWSEPRIDLDKLSEELSTLLDRVRDELPPLLAPGIHWLRFFVMIKDSKLSISEALLDNEPWARGLSLLQTCTWPAGTFTAREFLTLKA